MTTPYDQIGAGYATTRATDLQIAAQIWAALGSAETVVNVGAGSGSYEPLDRTVVAVEPSAVMIGQRRPDCAPAVQASAESLPFADRSFDAAMAVLTIHHWADPQRGLAEMRRVARRRVLVLTWDQDIFDTFWLVSHYVPAITRLDRARSLSIPEITAALGPSTVVRLPIPADCTDGFLGAFWRRPRAYLDPNVRSAISAFRQIEAAAEIAGIKHLTEDLASGVWQQRYGNLLNLNALDIGYRLIITES